MKFRFDNKYIKWGITAFLVIAASLMFYNFIFQGPVISTFINKTYTLLMPVIFGFVMGYLLTPILNFIEGSMLYPLAKKCKIKNSSKLKNAIRAISIILTVAFFVLIIYLLFIMLLSQIIPSIQNIVANFDNYVNNITTWINNLLVDNPQFKDTVLNMLNRYSEELEDFLNNTILTKSSAFIMTISLSIISVLKVLWNFIIGFIISIYILSSKEKFSNQSKKLIYAMFKKDRANIILNNFRFAHKTFIGFISGKILDSAIIGVLCFIGTSILGTPYAALVSLIVGVTNIIPFFGPFLGAIPSSILILVVDPLHPLNFVYFVLFVFALQQLDGNLIGPMILGDSTGLSGFWVIFAITVFGGLWGVFGMIVGVPLFAIIYAAIRSILSMSLLKKNLPQNTSDYANVESIDNNGINHYEKKLLKQNKKKQQQEITKYVSGMRFISSADEWNYYNSSKYEEEQMKTLAISNDITNEEDESAKTK